jgi:hypothetical protein
MKIGLGVGLGLGIPLLLAIGAALGYFVLAKNRNSMTSGQSSQQPAPVHEIDGSKPIYPELPSEMERAGQYHPQSYHPQHSQVYEAP